MGEYGCCFRGERKALFRIWWYLSVVLSSILIPGQASVQWGTESPSTQCKQSSTSCSYVPHPCAARSEPPLSGDASHISTSTKATGQGQGCLSHHHVPIAKGAQDPLVNKSLLEVPLGVFSLPRSLLSGRPWHEASLQVTDIAWTGPRYPKSQPEHLHQCQAQPLWKGQVRPDFRCPETSPK